MSEELTTSILEMHISLTVNHFTLEALTSGQEQIGGLTTQLTVSIPKMSVVGMIHSSQLDLRNSSLQVFQATLVKFKFMNKNYSD